MPATVLQVIRGVIRADVEPSEGLCELEMDSGNGYWNVLEGKEGAVEQSKVTVSAIARLCGPWKAWKMATMRVPRQQVGRCLGLWTDCPRCSASGTY